MKKKLFFIVLALIMVLCLVTPLMAAQKLKVAVVVADQLGDRGFADSANIGLLQAAKKFPIQYKVLECKTDPSVYYDRILTAAQNFDVVFLDPGYFFDKELAEIVPKFPDVKFVYIDGISNIPKMISIRFKENEGAFLAGALAGLMASNPALKKGTPNHIVGFVGGADWPVIRNFETGYIQGAKYVDPNIQVVSMFAGTHFDPAKGKETALEVHRKGANIIFQAAGPTGLGVFEAAKEANFYAIGVDIDQCSSQPGYIMASDLKRVDRAVYDTIAKAVAGNLKQGDTSIWGVANGGVGLCNCEEMKKIVPSSIMNKIKTIEQELVSGKITVKEYSSQQ